MPHLRFLLFSNEDSSWLALCRCRDSLLKHLSSQIGPLAVLSLQIPVYPLLPSGDYVKEQILGMQGRDGHAKCISWLGKSHADAALGTDCSHCESFSLASLRSRIAFFSDSNSRRRVSSCRLNARVPRHHCRESIRRSSSLNKISVPPWLRVM